MEREGLEKVLSLRIFLWLLYRIPSEVSERVVKRFVNFAKVLNLLAIGIVENMSGFICPHRGTKVDILGSGAGEKIARELKVPFLGKISLIQK